VPDSVDPVWSGLRVPQEVYAIPFMERYVIYAPLHRVAFFANGAAVDLLASLQDGVSSEATHDHTDFLELLRAVGLLCAESEAAADQLPGDDRYIPTEVTLFLTTRCNLACIYCYASAGCGPVRDMDLLTAQRGIDFVFRNALQVGARQVRVGYHGGGEPTLNWRMLTGSLSYARALGREHGIDVHATLATNGVLSREKRAWLIQNVQNVSLSLDGEPRVQDRQRPRVGGGTTASAVFRALSDFEAGNLPYGVRMTVTGPSASALAESIRYLLERGRPRSIQVEPVALLGRGDNPELQVDPDAFVAAFREANEVAAEYGLRLTFSAARIDTLQNRFCRSCGHGFSLTPTGSVTACFEVPSEDTPFADKFIIGRYDDGRDHFVFDDGKIRALQRRTVENIAWCRDCFAKWHCAGDCYHKALHAAVNGDFTGSPRCEITRSLILDQIAAKIVSAGGIVWTSGRGGNSERRFEHMAAATHL
jgi:uncharacterized protein